MPRSGGDYVFVSRTLRPAIGFAMSFTYIIFLIFVIGGSVQFISTVGIAGYLTSLGLLQSNQALIALGIAFSSTTAILVIGTIVIALMAAITFAGTRWITRCIAAMFVLGVISLVIIGVTFVVFTQTDFINTWNNLLGSIATYQGVQDLATSKGFTIGSGLGLTFAASLYAVYNYAGYFAGYYVGGEIKDASKAMPLSSLGDLWIAWAVYIVLIPIVFNVIGYNFNAAANYVAYNGFASLPAIPYVPFLAALLIKNPFVITVMFVGVIFFFTQAFLVWFIGASRNFFGWALDRVLPTNLASLGRSGSPTVSILITTVFAELGLLLALYVPVFSGIGFFNWSFMAVLMFGIACIAVILFPFVRKDLFECTPRIVKYSL
jgi:amino acid transporter